MAKRRFNFRLSVRRDASRHLHDSLNDADYAAGMAARFNLPTNTRGNSFVTRFKAKPDAIGTQESSQKAKAGEAGTLTEAQDADLQELERLMAGARRSARLAFADDHVKLHSEFQVGVDDPKTLEAKLDRAGIIVASCRRADNAAALQEEGWSSADADVLDAAIGQLSGSSLAQDDALDDRIGLTAEKIVAANAVYRDALRIQNAARLQYPANKPGMEAPRKRFLLDVFPPRDRSEPSGTAQTPSIPGGTIAPVTPSP